MVGGDRGDQGGLADLQYADPVAAATARTPWDCAATWATTSTMTSAADGCAQYSVSPPVVRRHGRESCRRTPRRPPLPDGSPVPRARPAGSVDRLARHAPPPSLLVIVLGELARRAVQHVGSGAQLLTQRPDVVEADGRIDRFDRVVPTERATKTPLPGRRTSRTADSCS